ncbi:HD-GYP domain-containing protein [Parasphingopyxis marina]|uniref:HD domain-containing protein n=1 Tax=Parasphingopyxis marina TaxID=2761622 RepID=A0A842HY60_9SPHN|nr:HD domain-containing protein [Parasphingopyxis marina]MBC2776860.1 HD domain-containing protein [Parasphingopyxis marina]
MLHGRFSDAFPQDSERLVSLAEILSAFSYALDLTEGQPEGHCVRSCWIGTRIGQALGLPENDLWELYYTLLMKDLGCSSNAARICELYLADDHRFKHDYKFVDGNLGNVLKFVFTRTGTDAPFTRRVGAIANILKNGPEIARSLVETRCMRGADIARQLRFSDNVADGIAGLDEHWDGSGKPNGVAGDAIPLFSRVALLAQIVDIFWKANGREAACDEVKARTGSWFDPELCTAFLAIAGKDDFWTDLAAPDIEQQIFALEPAQQVTLVDEDYLDDIASAFGQVIDAKSPYTSGHSNRVGDYVDGICAHLGYADDRSRTLRRAAILHDIGKLGVSNLILDKPGKLDEEEWAIMRDHARHTTEILGRISIFEDMAAIAGAHHERLDGTGYPLGLDAVTISMDTRIISVCDFYDALVADRPYRGAMPREKALTIIKEEVGAAIDPRCFEALEAITEQ